MIRRWLETRWEMWSLLKRGREALQASEKRYRQLLESNIIGVMKVDWDDRILAANDAFLNLLGYTREDILLGKLGGDTLTPPEYRQVDAWARMKLKESGVCPPIEKEYIRKDGTRTPVIVGVVFHDQPEQHLVCLVIDASERRRAMDAVRKAYDEMESRVRQRTAELAQANLDLTREVERRREAEATLKKLSITDPLTSLCNRRGFDTLASQLVKQAQRARHALLVVVADLDGLKAINDTHGHPEGDRALQCAAAILKDTFRDSDVIARVGGDEFAVAVREDVTDSGRQAVLERLQNKIDEFNSRASLPYTLSMSVGTAELLPRQAKTLDALLAHADTELYERKREKKLKVF